MSTRRTRCPGCDSLLQIRTPPFVQTIACPRCQQVSRFQLGDPVVEDGRVHGVTPPRTYRGDNGVLSYQAPYGEVVPLPEPVSYRPTPPRRPVYEEDALPVPAPISYPPTPPRRPVYEEDALPVPAPISYPPTPTRQPVYGENTVLPAPVSYRPTPMRPDYVQGIPVPPQPVLVEEDVPSFNNRPAGPRPAYAEDMPSYYQPTTAVQPLYGERMSPSKYRPKPHQRNYVEEPSLDYAYPVTSKPMYPVEKPSQYPPTASPRSYVEDTPGYHSQTSPYEDAPEYYRPTPIQSPHRVGRPVAIAPSPTLQPLSSHGRKRAVLCGVSYYGSKYQLKGSVNDVKRMRYFLTDNIGFPENCIFTLTEDEKHPQRTPTRYNIQMALRWLVQGCQAGDSLVFYYSGHGSRVRDRQMDEVDGYNESLCPLDFEAQGKIIDDELNAMIVASLPYGAKLHAIIDASYSGTILDLPYVCKMNRGGRSAWEDHTHVSSCYKGTNGGLAISITACDDDQTTGDTTALTGTPTGALTYGFIQAAQNEPGTSYGCLLNAMYSALHQANSAALPYTNGSSQDPQLSSSEKFDIYTKKFIL